MSGSGRRVVDLAHTITEGLVTYPGIPAPTMGSHLSFDGSVGIYAEGTEFTIGTISMATNTGTYLDTPAHRYRDGQDLATFPLERMVDLDGVVLATSQRSIDVADLARLDVRDKAVLVATGHDRHFGTEAYLVDHPHLTAEAAAWLVAEGAALVGIDSLNIDGTHTGDRPVHTALLAAGIPVVEHLTGLQHLPATGFRFTAAPPKVAGLGTFTVRAFAVVPT